MREATVSPGPRPRLEIIGGDGSAFAILGKMQRAAKAAGWSDERWKEVRGEATSGDYDHLLGVAMKHFDVVGPEDEDEDDLEDDGFDDEDDFEDEDEDFDNEVNFDDEDDDL